MTVGQSRVTIVCGRSSVVVTGQRGTSGHVSVIMTTMDVVCTTRAKYRSLWAPVHPASGPLWGIGYHCTSIGKCYTNGHWGSQPWLAIT